MNESHVCLGSQKKEKAFSEHQRWNRFGVIHNKFCFGHDKFGVSGKHPRSFPEASES